ncbi:two-component system nitrogen regulation sensor histidine kinase GlnL [Altererythrobacter atlanticus]|uniref:histidine kinase n=1 Tax=Croceibacterium atlanticum TaxID=1267766 RepID=A0A0F7KPY3_9SPHN|nr:ATP-binding protein [Croceibacterium atlanticum]AKH41614.1 Nitrogen regulation protein NR(II) [Croceibacterium atlanticum]MBB5733076.1 two-component system nitrogen regulation sensor histidine kinase GlnL [Croceibacterium atlanticum]
MSDILAGPPEPREQIAGLTFALLLVDPDLVIREVNPAAENLLGRSSRRLIGKKLLDILVFAEQRIVERLVAQEESQLVARGLALQVDDRAMTINLTVSAVSSRPGWRVVTLSDAGQGDRLGDEDRASGLRGPAILAHEIKNPLSAIRGAAQLVSRKLEEKDRALTGLIADEVDRIAQLIDRMQRLGREQPEPVSPFNLHAAIHRACDTVVAASSSPVPIREEFDPSLPPVLANEGALVQVLINLLSNARDACEGQDQPEIVVRTRFVSGLVMNVIRLGRPVKLPIEVQVSDNGPGIDPALRDHIFEPFVSSKKNGQGLGLALVHKLVRDMDGRISHERDEDGGWTHFRVHLPMAK